MVEPSEAQVQALDQAGRALPPTSAPVERAFTIQSNHNAQQSMMENLTIMTLMEAFNNSQHEKETLESMLERLTHTRRPN